MHCVERSQELHRLRYSSIRKQFTTTFTHREEVRICEGNCAINARLNVIA